MLHLRVLCSAADTAGVLERLQGEPGVTHLTVVRGAAVQPEGDLVQADVAREAADDVLAVLCDLGVDRTGGITLQPLDAVLSDAADAAERAAPGLGADAVVWDELVHHTGEESQLNATFLAFLTLACLIAAVGVITDSPVTVMGAMAVGSWWASSRPAARCCCCVPVPTGGAGRAVRCRRADHAAGHRG